MITNFQGNIVSDPVSQAKSVTVFEQVLFQLEFQSGALPFTLMNPPIPAPSIGGKLCARVDIVIRKHGLDTVRLLKLITPHI